VYLPLLELSKSEHVVVDMIASNDAAATSIPTGFTFAIISIEPTPHSIKAAKQIHETLEFFNVPHGYVLNKARDVVRDTQMIIDNLNETPISIVPLNTEIADPSFHLDHKNITLEIDESMHKILTHVQSYIEKHGDIRRERSTEKMARNKNYKDTVLS
jgi:MinD superfamily P-loop ATPase